MPTLKQFEKATGIKAKRWNDAFDQVAQGKSNEKAAAEEVATFKAKVAELEAAGVKRAEEAEARELEAARYRAEQDAAPEKATPEPYVPEVVLPEDQPYFRNTDPIRHSAFDTALRLLFPDYDGSGKDPFPQYGHVAEDQGLERFVRVPPYGEEGEYEGYFISPDGANTLLRAYVKTVAERREHMAFVASQVEIRDIAKETGCRIERLLGGDMGDGKPSALERRLKIKFNGGLVSPEDAGILRKYAYWRAAEDKMYSRLSRSEKSEHTGWVAENDLDNAETNLKYWREQQAGNTRDRDNEYFAKNVKRFEDQVARIKRGELTPKPEAFRHEYDPEPRP